MITYIKANPEDLERIWDWNIADNPGDARWVAWKREAIENNRSGNSATFVIVYDGEPIGEGTLLFSPTCKAISGRTQLADHAAVANINALRIRKEYEGKGYVSALVRRMESYARELGYEKLTIGVEAKETRNLGIYLHWGYGTFVLSEIEDNTLVLYYAKNLYP